MANPMGRGTADMEELHARRMRAMELRKLGKSYPEIALELNVSIAQAFKDVNHRLKEIIKNEKESVEEVRELELNRLDTMLATIMPQVEKGNFDAIELALKIQTRRARFLGLDAAAKIDVDDKRQSARNMNREEIWNRLRELHERLAVKGLKFDPILTERNPFQAERELQASSVEGVVVRSEPVVIDSTKSSTS